jgi:hypothetical protein
VLRPAFEVRTPNLVQGPIILGESGRAYWRELDRSSADTWLVAANPDGTVRYRARVDRAWAFSGGWARAFDLLVGEVGSAGCSPDARVEARRTSDGTVAWTRPAAELFGADARACSTPAAPAVTGSSVVLQARTCDRGSAGLVSCDQVLAWLGARTGAIERVVGVDPEPRATDAGYQGQPAVDADGTVYVAVSGNTGSTLASYDAAGTERYRVATPGQAFDVVAGAGLALVTDSLGGAALTVYRTADGSVAGTLPPGVYLLARGGILGLHRDDFATDDPLASSFGWRLSSTDPNTLDEVWARPVLETAPYWTSVGAPVRTRGGTVLFHRDEWLPFDAIPGSPTPAWIHEHDATGAEVLAVELPGSGRYDAVSALGDELWWTIEHQDDGGAIVRGFRLPGRSPATAGQITSAGGNMARDGAER